MLKPLANFLKEPALKGLDVDDPRSAEIHKKIIQRKPLLWDVRSSFFREFVLISQQVPPGHLVELGSGNGLLKTLLPSVVTSDVIDSPDVDRIFSAEDIPYGDATVSAFFLLDVFHHIKNPRVFLQEVDRCLRPDGRLIMIEPSSTPWGRFAGRNFHHESHDPKAGWQVSGSRPLSDANMALPWIVFVRDRKIFEQEFPRLVILRCQPHTPLRFLLSGGVTYRSIVPTCCIPLVKLAERTLSPFNKILGMYMTIEIHKTAISKPAAF